MTDPLVCSIPNFSEGRDRAVIDAIVDALDGDGAHVLHVDPNPDAHRVVVTLAGPLPAVERALFRGIATATSLIDMRGRTGEHIRVGASDVIPFVALDGLAASAEACVAAAHRLGRRLASELSIPVYFYEDAALRDRFRALPRCRRGGYEALPGRFAEHRRTGRDGPDVGPTEWLEVARSGASVLGARGLLVAMNFTLDGGDVDLARRIAAAIRTRGPKGRVDRREGLRAVGWVMAGYAGRAQVSTNLLDPVVTPAGAVHTLIRRLAAVEGARVAGAELIGLIPAWVLADASVPGDGYRVPGKVLDFQAADDHAAITAGIRALGLTHLGDSEEDLKQRCLEARLRAHALLD